MATMATTHPRSRPIYCSPPLGYAAQREDFEHCTHLLTRRLCASSRATASLIVAHARSSSAFRTPTCQINRAPIACSLHGVWCLLSTPLGPQQERVASCALHAFTFVLGAFMLSAGACNVRRILVSCTTSPAAQTRACATAAR